ncbi:MAG TPA: protein kinase, partial [Gemmatimonadales bacterium]|nr:protein kinase [Gemmatimonadales bacterium]
RLVALKVLHAELAATLGPERFQREIRLAARLQHPHILTVLDSGEAVVSPTTLLWFTMPYVEGESLRDRLRRERQLPVDDALRITREAAQGLQYAHEHGVIHRDIKPENLLLTRDGSTLVADFGIARALGAGDEKLTETGLAVGTPAYMSPEQAAGERNLDARTDIYSLGTVLYEMLAGETPFAGPTAQAMIARRLTEAPPSLGRVRESVPEPVDRTVQRALARTPADRFATAGQFAAALAAPAGGTSGETAVVRAPAGRRRLRLPTAAAILLLGFVLGLGLLFAWRHNQSGGEEAGARRLAVLPFQNLGDSSDRYFADGIADAIRGKLADLPGLRVIARSSSEEYAGTRKAPQQIGNELGVRYLLTGTVRWEKHGDTSRVQVSPELIDARDATTRWQQPFGAALADVFQVQSEIAGRVAQALDLELGDSAQRSLAAPPTRNLEAYNAYLRGEEVSQGLSVASPVVLRQAASYYAQATTLDPGFAKAWARLSMAKTRALYNGVPSAAEAEEARAAAEQALELRPDLPDGHLALGWYNLVTGRYDEAETEFAAGLRLAPDHADLLGAAAANEQLMGQWEPAREHLERAAAHDPRSPLTLRRLGFLQLWLRHYPEARATLDRALALEPGDILVREQRAMVDLAEGDLAAARAVIRAAPSSVDPASLVTIFGNYWDLYWALDDAQQQLLLRLGPEPFGDRGAWGIVLAETYWVRGDTARARIYADSARIALADTTPEDSQRLAFLGLALAYLGQRADALRMAGRAAATLSARPDSSAGRSYITHVLTRLYILTGDTDRALDGLEALLGVPYFLSPRWLRIDPTFDPVRNEPRFRKLAEGTS